MSDSSNADAPSVGEASPASAGCDPSPWDCCATNVALAPPPGSSGSPAPASAPAARGAQSPNTLAPSHDTYPTLPRTPSSVGGQFDLASQDYLLTVYADMKYVKGWIEWVIQLDALVPATTGGGNKVNFGPFFAGATTFSGTDWRFAKASIVSVDGNGCSASGYWYWDGSRWQDVPSAFVDLNTVKLCPNGIWAEGTTYRAQYGGTWPVPIQAWGPDEQAACGRVLPQWVDTIQTTWSNQFDLKRKDCPSSDGSCCRYHPKISATFSETKSFPIDLTKSIVLAGNNAARSNVRAWSLQDSRKYLSAHEFGHLLGMPDEYAGGGIPDTTMNDDGATQGIDPTSLMGLGCNDNTGKLAVVKKRHYRVIGWQLAAMVDAASGTGKCLGYVFEAVPGTS